MLVDINLLPEKIKERSTLLWVAIVILAVALLSWAAFFWLTQKNNEEAQALQQQAFEIQKQQETITSQLRPSSFGQEKEQLASTVEWLEGYHYKTVPLIEELVQALPERGFFLEFTFTAPNEATFDVQFDDLTEAAHYLTRMKASSLISGATFEVIETEGLDSDEKVLPRYIARYFVQFLDERGIVKPDATVDPNVIEQPQEPSQDDVQPPANEEIEGGGTDE
ncbi:PilN domain-containing protein [Sporosarcina obsidiansis]|uniref:PilN domain-containing protein n=1 Tax=Sporosarcina obsidiansis TaxID=2660748 RepID=UPI00129BCABB|nr:hypothetical protein [Sporosarcina obsidiansis]